MSDQSQADSASEDPLDDIRNLIASLPAADEQAQQAARARQTQLTKPPGSLGRLEEIAVWMAAWQGHEAPRSKNPLIAVFAANHGITSRGVSAYPAHVTEQMVENFRAGGAAINQICKAHDAALKVYELALDLPTPDIAEQDAFDAKSCTATIAYGMGAANEPMDFIGIGEMGIGNTSVAAAICYALFGGSPAEWTGRGTGIDDPTMARKQEAVASAVARLGPGPHDPLEVLRRIGGREFAAIIGAIIAARFNRIPVIIDGYVVSAAAAILYACRADALDHCLFSHCSAEAPHRTLLSKMDKKPVFDLEMRLGEASGAALAIPIIQAAVDCHNNMQTFDEANVSGPV